MTEEPPDDQSQNKKQQEVPAEITKAMELKRELREKNIECLKNKPDEDFYRSLDSNLRKTTSFVKRLKNIGDDKSHTLLTFDHFSFHFPTFPGLYRELRTLNLTRYISEIVTSIAEAKIKHSDLPYVVQVCSAMHQRYPSFSRSLLVALQKSFNDTTPELFTTGSMSGEKGKDASKDSNGILFSLSALGLTDPTLSESYQQLSSLLPTGSSSLPLTTLSNAMASQPKGKQQLEVDVMMVALKQIGSPSTNASLSSILLHSVFFLSIYLSLSIYIFISIFIYLSLLLYSIPFCYILLYSILFSQAPSVDVTSSVFK